MVSSRRRSANAITDASTMPRLGELGDAGPVGVEHGLDEQLASFERAREGDFGVRTDPVAE
jgi:hypothetical protein